jgi:phosphoglycolate phosphatase-like HAD superfamily hydrolase
MSEIVNVGFDFDLTLADSRKSIQCSLEFALSGEPQAHMIASKIQIGNLTLDEIAKSLNLKNPEDFKERFRNFYIENSIKYTVLSPDCIAVLKQLRSFGFELFVVSSKTNETLIESLNFLGIARFFKEIQSVAESGDKTSALCKSEIQYYVGDTQKDIDSANEAGCHSIYFDFYSNGCVKNYQSKVSKLSDLIPLLLDKT